jgi:guanidinobutyrase
VGAAACHLSGPTLSRSRRPYDPQGNTALLAANLLYEMLCVLPGVVYRDGG